MREPLSDQGHLLAEWSEFLTEERGIEAKAAVVRS